MTKPHAITPDLTEKEAEAILAIEGGADVNDYGIATTLREMQRKGLEGEGGLFDITTVQNEVPDDKPRPYFGAIARKRGLNLAHAKLKK